MKLVDVVDQMPRHGPVWTRDESKIDTVVVHHSGSAGADGVEGATNSAKYSISVVKKLEAERRKEKPHYSYPYPSGPAYHLWVPQNQPLLGGPLVLQTNAWDAWTMHSNKLNQRAVAVCLQGNHQKKRNVGQYKALEQVLEMLADLFEVDRTRVVGHCELHLLGGESKPSCPGPGPMEVVKRFRGPA